MDTEVPSGTDTDTDTDISAETGSANVLSVIPIASVSAFEGRLALLEQLVNDIPLNEYGLPIGIYRLDLIPNNPSNIELRNAFVPLTYNEGFPSFADGRPLWTQLSFESIEAFQAFDGYLRLPLITGSGSRSLFDLTGNVQELGIPQITIEPEALQHFYFGYCWEHRVRAYDLWITASRRKAQENRAIATLDSHYFSSQRLMKRLMMYLEDEDSDEDFWDLMTPKVAIDFYNKLITAQRISSGMSASGGSNGSNSGSNGGNEGTSLEVIFRNLAQQNVASRESLTIDQSSELLQEALSDPDTAEMAQELIIKLNMN